jgi:hypothetical protein
MGDGLSCPHWVLPTTTPYKGDGVVRNKTVVSTDSSWIEVKFLYWYFLQPRKKWVVGFGCDSPRGM